MDEPRLIGPALKLLLMVAERPRVPKELVDVFGPGPTYRILKDLMLAGYVEKRVENGKVTYAITKRGLEKLSEIHREICNRISRILQTAKPVIAIA